MGQRPRHVGGVTAGRRDVTAPLLTARWSVTNFRGARVSTVEGPVFTALAVGGACAAGAAPAPALLAGGGALLAGRIDDVYGGAAERGLRGHGRAMLRGRPTTGALKVVLLAGAGSAAALAARRGAGTPRVTGGGSPGAAPDTALTAWLDTALTAGLVATSANLLNLLDLRPGRALKAVLVAALPIAAGRGRAGAGSPFAPQGRAVLAGAAAAALACLPADLAERAMLGDAGANPAGALTGLGLALTAGRRGRIALLAGGAALTLASEVVSFSRVIESVPPLRSWDRWGRRAGDPAAGPR